VPIISLEVLGLGLELHSLRWTALGRRIFLAYADCCFYLQFTVLCCAVCVNLVTEFICRCLYSGWLS